MNDNLAENSFDYQAFYLNLENSIVYKNKSLIQWSSELKLPNLDSESTSLEAAQILNFNSLKLTETIYEHLSLTKVSFLSAKANYNMALIKARQKIMDDLNAEIEKKKIPSNEALEKQSSALCIDLFIILSISELVFEFWNTMSYKISQVNARLTSLNILTNIEYKTSGH